MILIKEQNMEHEIHLSKNQIDDHNQNLINTKSLTDKVK